MQNSGFVLSEYKEINSLLYKPIIATQRIKYTCFNVSTNHIALGSSSGSLYLFKKESCVFQQLFPISEGTVTQVSISPDEKAIALSTKRGSVCIISLKPSVKLLSVSNEHIGDIVTCLCWNDKSTEVYVGDDHGKISTIVLSIFAVNGIFQTPSCALMHLDSSIIQTDYISHYLLVSTLTRCYICDTTYEQFKQIGNKARDGDYGACFFNRTYHIGNKRRIQSRAKRVKKCNNANSIFEKDDNILDQNIVIICARPGCRLWEVTIGGIVVKTHEFKNALALPSTNIFQSSNVHFLNESQQNEQIVGRQTLNFSRLYVFKQKYLITFTSKGLYVIDIENAAIILWTDQLKNISAAQIFDDKIYLMKKSGTFHCLVLNTVDNLIMKLYEGKMYNDCLRACMTFRSDLINFSQSNIKNTDNITSINDIVLILKPVLSIIQSNSSNLPKILSSGIVVVNIRNSKFTSLPEHRNDDNKKCNLSQNCRFEDNNFEDSICKKFVTVKKNSLKLNTIDYKKKNASETSLNTYSVHNHHLKTFSLIALRAANFQADFYPIDLLKASMTKNDLEQVILRVSKIFTNVNAKYMNINSFHKHSHEISKLLQKHYDILLTNISWDILKRSSKHCIRDELLKAYVYLKLSESIVRFCGYKKTNETVDEPILSDFGRSSFLSHKDSCIGLYRHMPYMWQYYLLSHSSKNDDLDMKDNIVITILLSLMNSKQWKIHCTHFVHCVKELKKDHFTKSDNDKNQSNMIDWSKIVFSIIKQERTDEAMLNLRLLKSYVPKTKMKKSIFGTLIFNKLLNYHGFEQKTNFDQKKFFNKYSSVCFAKIKKLLVDTLEKDLKINVSGNNFGSGAHHWGFLYEGRTATCPCCTLALRTPILLDNGLSIFPCGHAYHVNCLLQKKLTRCFLHY